MPARLKPRPKDARQLQALDPAATSLLEVLSVVMLPVGNAPLQQLLSDLGSPARRDSSFRAALSTLEDNDMIDRNAGGIACAFYWRDIAAIRPLAEGRTRSILARAQRRWPADNYNRWSRQGLPRFIRNLRVAALLGDGPSVNAYHAKLRYADTDPWLEVDDGIKPVALSFAAVVSPSIAREWVRSCLTQGLAHWRIGERSRAIAWSYGDRDDIQRMLCYDHFLRAAAVPESLTLDPALEAELAAMATFTRGDLVGAIAGFDAALQHLKKKTRKRKLQLSGLGALFHGLSLALSSRHSELDALNSWTWKQSSSDDLAHNNTLGLNDTLGRCLTMLKTVGIVNPDARHESMLSHTSANDPWYCWAAILVAYWTSNGGMEEGESLIFDLFEKAQEAGFDWLAAECDVAHQRLGARLDDRSETNPTKSGAVVDMFAQLAPWQRKLQALRALPKQSKASTKVERLCWRVTFGDTVAITPYLQKALKKGWTAGRSLALKHLFGKPLPAYVTPYDEKVIRGINNRMGQWGPSYEISDAAIVGLVDHPWVFRAEDKKRELQVVAGEIRLHTTKRDNTIELSVKPDPPGAPESKTIECSQIWVSDEGDRIVVYPMSEVQRRLLDLVWKGITVPTEGENELQETIGALAGMVAIVGDLEQLDIDHESIAADPTLHLQLTRTSLGLRLRVMVKPLGMKGPSFAPGRGGLRVLAKLDQKRVVTKRDLKREKATLLKLLDCPQLEGWTDPTGSHEVDNLEGSLELLSHLRTLADDVSITWPEGTELKLVGQATTGGFRLTVTHAASWLSARGEVTVDDGAVVAIKELLRSAAEPGQSGRFVRLQDGGFLALSEDLRRQLRALAAFTMTSKTGTRLHPLASHVLSQLADNKHLKLDKSVKKRVERVQRAQRSKPKVPKTFAGELRDYQLTGFCWLMRLTAWGAGACLADDMGLGKTIQILALLLARAKDGPALVVAPLSVCGNWEAEARRFTPTLQLKTMAAGDRKQTMKSLGRNDLLICSYGLMTREKDALAEVEFETIVLDEAQAIKNAKSKRAAAAYGLMGNSRIIATGTPIENRLTELYSLLRFLNPGLLGSEKKFRDNFARPIEKDGDRRALDALRRKVRPFMLRRTKAEVLDELPARTDVTLSVTAPPDERAVYEALRTSALEALEGGPAKLTGRAEGQRRFAILAELTKLRRACCHPSLVVPKKNLPGAKLGACLELVDELIAARHRALVFSHYVGLLSIVRAALDEREISYQYLDGKTSAKKRGAAVKAFQAGEGDLFLISTKAGGFGLNLTGADYVIHLDPWWNPAVEDQASDRAHRIGQSRPVTVYRLVMADTIEEKIVEMHQQKRQLARSLLDGADAAATIGSDELMRLLGDG